MKLKVIVEDLKLNINVGQGLNDFVWLALAAAKLYGKTKYPPGNYLPAILKIFDFIPHPRQRIIQLLIFTNLLDRFRNQINEAKHNSFNKKDKRFAQCLKMKRTQEMIIK